MRVGGIFSLLLLASCAGGGRDERPREPAARPALAQTRQSPAPPTAEARQCLAGLDRDRIEYRLLPDRDFGGGCIASNSVQLREVGTPTRNLGAMTCPLAATYARWAREVLQPAAQRHFGRQVTLVETFGTYNCRPIAGTNRLSEHGRANAVDVWGFTLDGGQSITVLEGWNGDDDRVRMFLRDLHRGACGRFQIVLGPDANADHRNHFHFDMGRGPYCR